MKQELQYPLAG